MGKLIPMAKHVEEIEQSKEPQSRLRPDSPSLRFDENDLLPSEDDPCWEIPNKPKRSHPIKIKIDKPALISITEKEAFINWLRTSTSNNPQLKRMRYKDGGFRDCIPRGLIDLFNEFRERV